MEFWFFIALIAIAGSYFHHRTEIAQLELGTKMDHIEDSGVQKELDHIKQRLAVLERIITDKNYDLNEAFSELDGESAVKPQIKE